MAWLRLDDGYDTNPKLLELTECQRWRWTRALIHAARHRTQGHLGQAVLRELGLGGSTTVKLVNIGLLEPVDNGYYRIHDWNDYNGPDPRAAQAERQRKHRDKKRDTSVTETVTDRDIHRDENVTRAQARARVPSPTPKNTRAVTESRPATPAQSEPNGPEIPHIPDILKTMP